MSYAFLGKWLGFISAALGLGMAPSALYALYLGERNACGAFAAASAACLLVGAFLYVPCRAASGPMYQREALGLVGLAWISAGLLGALPFLFSGTLALPDAVFESVSGFTTTGASVLDTVEALPRSLLFWRAFTHWLGGVGIVVIFIAVLPFLGVGGKQMLKSEITGPDPRAMRPRIKESALLLCQIYLVLTVFQLAALLFTRKMDLFDAVCHTFSTLATGGFSTRQASVGAFDSLAVELIILTFIICGASSFALYFSVLRGDWRAFIRDPEWRVFAAVLTLATLLISLNLAGVIFRGDLPLEKRAPGYAPDTAPVYAVPEALRLSAFHAASIMTGTGFATDNFDEWPFFARKLLILLMFAGGCAGSTTGGLKIIRIMILVRMIQQQVERAFRPKTIRALRIGGKIIEPEIQHQIAVFFALYILVFGAGCLVMSASGLPFETAAASVAATLNNIGPGLELVGSHMSYSVVPAAGKYFLSLLMILGRLELFVLFAMLAPSFWRPR